MGETGLAGKSVYLDMNDNGQFDADEPLTKTVEDDPLTSDTDESGCFSFSNVEPGSHRVAPLIADGWSQVFQAPQTRLALISNGWKLSSRNGQ